MPSQQKFENYAESAKMMLSRQKICRVSKKIENYADSAKIMVSRQKICQVSKKLKIMLIRQKLW